MASSVDQRRSDAGQAAVETALTLPLVLFLFLGTLQLMLAFNARLMAQYAAFSATRSGAVDHARCEPMLHAALLAVSPTVARADSPERVASIFRRHKSNRFDPATDGGHDGEMLWLVRERPTLAELSGGREDFEFDAPGHLSRLELRLVYWYPLEVPFANWVFSRLALAHWGLESRHAVDPKMPARTVRWSAESGHDLPTDVAAELLARAHRGQYVLPLHATGTMRMMTPALASALQSAGCR